MPGLQVWAVEVQDPPWRGSGERWGVCSMHIQGGVWACEQFKGAEKNRLINQKSQSNKFKGFCILTKGRRNRHSSVGPACRPPRVTPSVVTSAQPTIGNPSVVTSALPTTGHPSVVTSAPPTIGNPRVVTNVPKRFTFTGSRGLGLRHICLGRHNATYH